MLKFIYKIDPGGFTDINAYSEYLNRMGEQGYELVQYERVNRAHIIFNFDMYPRKKQLYFVTTWKKENPK